MELPDLWSQLQTYSFFSQASSIPEDDLQPYRDDEKAKIKERLQQLEDHIAEKYDLFDEQLEFIKERLDYLSRAVDRLNRFDWKAQAISTFISIAVNLGIDTATGRGLLQYIKQLFGSIAGLLPS